MRNKIQTKISRYFVLGYYANEPPEDAQGVLATGVTGVEPAESRFGDDRLNRWAPPLYNIYPCSCRVMLAERERFELSEGLLPQRFSKPPH